MRNKLFVIGIVFMVLLSFNGLGFIYNGLECSEEPTDYVLYNTTGVNLTSPLNVYHSLITTGNHTVFLNNIVSNEITAERPYFGIKETAGYTITFLAKDGFWQYYTGGGYVSTGQAYVTNTPYNLTLTVDLDADLFNWTINGNTYENLGVRTAGQNWDYLEFYLNAKTLNISSFYIWNDTDCPTTPNVLTITGLQPLNNTQYNTNLLNFNASVTATNNYNASLYINGTLNQTTEFYSNVTNPDFNVSFGSDFDSEINFLINAYNDDSDVNTTTNYIFIDNVNPTITWTNPLEDNSSAYSTSTILNILLEDNNLYSFDINLTNSTGDVVWSDTNTSLTGFSSHTIDNTLDFTGNSSGVYQFDLKLCDGHTKNDIEDFNVVSDSYYLQFNEITIISFDAISTNYEKLKDRYSFGFETALPLEELEFTLPTSCEYIPNSKYFGHYVCNNKYWLDFEGSDYDEVEVTDNKIKIKSSYPRTNWQFNSIGVLNCVNEQVNVTIDATAPTLSNFVFKALDSDRNIIGTDETSFNSSNIQNIEYMNISFTLTDDYNLNNYSLFYTANGSNGCSLGNLQSANCYNYSDGNWIQYLDGGNSPTFNDTGTQGDFIQCDYNGSTTVRDYRCTIDEHYNPNVFKHYPYNFGDVLWQTGTTIRIKQSNIWKIDVSGRDIPTNAEVYKLDFRVNYTNSNIPDEAINAYFCNSTYTTGRPSLSDNCVLIAQKLPSDLQDDGTKFRATFTKNVITGYGAFKYILLTSQEATPNSYYYMKSIKYTGSESIITQTSSNSGATYTNLAGGYETELNVNWFSIPTSIIFNVQFDDGSNTVNDTLNEMTWLLIDLPLPPLVDIISPTDNQVITSNVTSINWTSSEPNGDTYQTNVTLFNTSNSWILGLNLPSTNMSFNYDFTSYSDGNYNITVSAVDNTSLSGTDTVVFTLDLVEDVVVPVNATFTFQRFECDTSDTGKSILFGFIILIVILIWIFSMYIKIPLLSVFVGFIMVYFAWNVASCFQFANLLFIVLGIVSFLLGISGALSKDRQF